MNLEKIHELNSDNERNYQTIYKITLNNGYVLVIDNKYKYEVGNTKDQMHIRGAVFVPYTLLEKIKILFKNIFKRD